MLVCDFDGAVGGIDSGDLVAASPQRRNDLGCAGDRDVTFFTLATEEN